MGNFINILAVVVTSMIIFVPMEKWIDIKGYEGEYQVSNLGKIKSLNRIVKDKNGVKMSFKGTLIKGYISNKGYLQVKLRKNNGKRSNFLVHRLVADSWLERGGLNVVNHKDGCKLNNAVCNLEWTTYKGNSQHAFDGGLSKGVFEGKLVLDKEMGIFYSSISDAANAKGIDRTCLSDRLNGKRFNETNLILV